MSNLLILCLANETPVSQAIRFKRSLSVHALKIWLIKHGDLSDGVLNIRLKDGITVLSTATIDYTEFNTLGTYAHGYFLAEFDAHLSGKKTGETHHEYTIEIEITGHTDSPTNYIGACLSWERPFVPVYGADQIDGNANASNMEALGIEIYKYNK